MLLFKIQSYESLSGSTQGLFLTMALWQRKELRPRAQVSLVRAGWAQDQVRGRKEKVVCASCTGLLVLSYPAMLGEDGPAEMRVLVHAEG